MDSEQHQSSSSDPDKTPSENDISESSQPHHQPQRTFMLFEVNNAFGRDAHHFLFIQRESNLEDLAYFGENLCLDIDRAHGTVEAFERIFTETDLKNIQASCLEILAGLSAINGCVTYEAILGKIEVTASDGDIWFYDTFDDECPQWETAFNIDSSQIIDLEEDTFV
ncbi:unnamed protein product [Clonostachys rhizophaga]|uniref:Uncharacterized protein n=1 Tax=Clonostachys rhizophaga TaxID=160324 RepID=A0A9N9YG49_9HYPO|nr:unnamed protein product [Clonostachys rhizophaga]